MRPRMVAILFSIALLPASAHVAVAQQRPAPRSYPELREIMQGSNSPGKVETANFEQPAWARTPANVAEPSQGSRPIIPVSGTSEAWPSSAPASSSRLSEPVAAPPAMPLQVPSEPQTGLRRTVSSPVHTLTIRESIPSEPPLLPQLQKNSNWQPSAYEVGAVAPPPATIGTESAPIPEPESIPPAPKEESYNLPSDPAQFSQQQPGSMQFQDPASAFADGAVYDEMSCDGCVEDRCAYRNMFPPVDLCQEPDPCGEFLPFGNLGIKPGNERVITGGGFFLPLWQSCDSMIFTDLRGSVDDHHSGDGYFGLGYRTYMDPQWIFGTYIYADLIATNQKNVFGQGQLGFELLSLNWDFRINGYAPGTATQAADTLNGISNGTVVTRDFREKAYSGFDFEIGQRFLNWGYNDRYEVRWFLGGYGFGQSSNVFPSFGGPRGRLEMRIFDLPWCGQQSRVEWGAEVSYDRVRDGQIYGYIRARIPFGPKQGRPALDPMRRRMVDTPIHRVD